ncbi:helix-turn-helix transcriptional regulator [Streptomyces sp. BV129]|uniref:helix-turn-helix domain-containing protein n=1 Tax=Streptomyces sp. BV129 TaxID=2849671 RepID=UPI001C2F0B10|nr:helix-turn-helix transcriptional regulator [Streptomyces sp. BV129]MBV1947908.1 helix-turn-helix domain-containing protein [Streptomyces sp. BV129]
MAAAGEETGVTGRTQRWKNIPSERSPDLGKFVTAMRDLKDCTSLTQERVAEASGLAASTYSSYLNGARLPKEKDIRAIYSVIADDVRLRNRALTSSLDELIALRERASLCTSCPRRGGNTGAPAPESLSAEASTSEPGRPAPRLVRGRARKRVRIYGGRRRTTSAPSRTEVPVPLPEGDRHLTRATSPALATELALLQSNQAAGRVRDAYMLVWDKARKITPGDLPEVLAAYRASGLEEAADALLRTVVVERDVNAVLNIVAALHDGHQYTDAQTILAAARTDL